MATNPVLAVGQDSMILSTRVSILRGAGYAVESATSAEQAINQFRSGDFGLVILCHTMPPEERRTLARLIRASGSSIPVIYVQPLIEPSTDGLADAIIGSHPIELLSGVEEALNRATVRHRQSTGSEPKPMQTARGNTQQTDST
jgi:DNA-binding response OmpR family regulator